MYRTGNSYLNMKMKEGNFSFGGEYSGHIFYRDRFAGFDDGIYAGMRFLEMVILLLGRLAHARLPIGIC